ncbi:hypothetical protein LBMAG53_16960 [Planctomycetota bacterium]|nr:hypothetical protein LBMAG53_16960 [Planctomycetota bacterium]
MIRRLSGAIRRAVVGLLLGLSALPAGEWRIELSDAAAVQGIGALPPGGSLTIAWERSRPAGEAWLEPFIDTTDLRHAMVAAPLRLADGQRSGTATIRFVPADWAGSPLSDDLLALVARLGAIATGDAGPMSVRFTTAAGSAADPAAVAPTLVDRGCWREWRLTVLDRAAGGLAIATGAAAVIDGQGRHWPCFPDQPWVADAAGRWLARGSPRWVLRLAAGENPVQPLRFLWWKQSSADQPAPDWKSPPLPQATLSSAEPPPGHPPLVPAPIAWPLAAAWTGQAERWFPGQAAQAGFRLLPPSLSPAAPAPVLTWSAGWGGMRGPGLVAWHQAAAWDAVLANGLPAIDLLPAAWWDEQGAFRFGTGPWSVLRPSELWADDRWRSNLLSHVRTVIARSRAAPGLREWQAGSTGSVPAGGEAGLRTLATTMAATVAAWDARPLLFRHPLLVDFAKDEPLANGWFGFEDGPQGWEALPLADFTRSQVAAIRGPGAAAGQGWLRLSLPAVGAERAAGAWVRLDSNVANLDRLDLSARLDAPSGSVRLFAFCTDERHRWYQQDLGEIPAWSTWLAVTADFRDEALWEAKGHTTPWTSATRRRLRCLGLTAWYHGQVTGPVTVGIDALRRRGWVVEDTPPQLTFRSLRLASWTAAPRSGGLVAGGTPTPGRPPTSGPPADPGISDAAETLRVPRWQPIGADFDLSRASANPYDPDSADVVGEVEGPAGQRLSWPAWWHEPYELAVDRGIERALPNGTGHWRWRFLPTSPGLWKWRIVARLKLRKEWQQTTSAWHQVEVSAAADPAALPPIRICARDPTWFETVDGAFCLPLGLTLRSPGDGRQDDVLSQIPGKQKDFSRSRDWERLGTGAYERWFTAMQAHGLDWARVWMCPWWCGQEWTREWDEYGGLTWYSQAHSARLDRVLDLAAAHGVRIQLELQNHGMTSPTIRVNGRNGVDSQWEESPYATENGGPCRHPIEFYSKETAWAIHAKRLRYCLARWGWRTAWAATALSSEMEFTGVWDTEAEADEINGHSPTLQRWVERSRDWFTDHDPLRRPLSFHFSHPWRAAKMWRIPGLGFSFSNAYTGFQSDMAPGHLGGTGERDLPLALDRYLTQHFPPTTLQRPTLLGEWGGHWSHNNHTQLLGELHTGLWLQAVLPYGGNVGFWWWLWIDAADQWSEYAAVKRFLTGDDRRWRNLVIANPKVEGSSQAQATGMAGDTIHRYYCWLKTLDQNPGLTSARDQGRLVVETKDKNATWRVERWDCRAGTINGTVELTADNTGKLRIPLGKLTPDAAFKLERIESLVVPAGR